MPKQKTATERIQQALVDSGRLSEDDQEVVDAAWGPATQSAYGSAVGKLMGGVWDNANLAYQKTHQPAVANEQFLEAINQEIADAAADPKGGNEEEEEGPDKGDNGGSGDGSQDQQGDQTGPKTKQQTGVGASDKGSDKGNDAKKPGTSGPVKQEAAD